MQKKRPFQADDVKEVVVRMAPGSVVDNRDMPDICIQHILAVMLIDKNVTFRSAHDKARMQDPVVLRHRAKVRLSPGAAGSKAPLVVVTLTDGTRLSEDVTAVLGTANNRMTREQVIAKCRDLISPVIRPQASEALIQTAFKIENLKNVRELRSLLQRA